MQCSNTNFKAGKTIAGIVLCSQIRPKIKVFVAGSSDLFTFNSMVNSVIKMKSQTNFQINSESTEYKGASMYKFHHFLSVFIVWNGKKPGTIHYI